MSAAAACASGDKLCFYSKSADAQPGKGARELVAEPSEYGQLACIKDWRKVLSNFHASEFKFEDGYTYKTIEHVFQAKKIELVDPEAAYQFTIDSGHEIGQGNGEYARAHRKMRLLSPQQVRHWAAISNDVMARAARCKYAASAEACQVLLLTCDAELWHLVPRGKPVRFLHLEAIREELRQQTQ